MKIIMSPYRSKNGPIMTTFDQKRMDA